MQAVRTKIFPTACDWQEDLPTEGVREEVDQPIMSVAVFANYQIQPFTCQGKMPIKAFD